MKLLPPISQKGYIQIVLVVFAVLIGLMIFPMKFPSNNPVTSGECMAGHPPTSNEVLRLPKPVHNITKYYPDTEEYISWGTGDPNIIEEYVMVRSNVPTPEKASTKNWLIFGTNPLTGLAHSIPIGEIPEKPGYTLYYPTSPAELRFSKEQIHLTGEDLIIFRNEDPASVKNINGTVYYSVDVYQKKERYDNPTRPLKDLFLCDPEGPQEPPAVKVTVPAQEVSKTKEQLQLEWFLFQEGGGGIWGIHCKPAVYLYPERKQLVNVKVFPKGQLSYTEPFYDPGKGWTVQAYPDGQLQTINDLRLTIHDYLYYESKILDSEIKKPSKGWTVKKDEMEELFDWVLPELGLNQKEANDFKEYWLTKLPEYPYYFVGLMDKSQRDYLEPLSVIPNPDTSIRFSLYFEPLDQPISVSEPEITTPERNGFTLVDWGGMIKLHPGTPFTCSQ